MKTLRCVVCGKVTEAHDYADAVICDTCTYPEVKDEASQTSTEEVQ